MIFKVFRIILTVFDPKNAAKLIFSREIRKFLGRFNNKTQLFHKKTSFLCCTTCFLHCKADFAIKVYGKYEKSTVLDASTFGSPLGDLWFTFGRPMGDLWVTFGRPLGKSEENGLWNYGVIDYGIMEKVRQNRTFLHQL